MRASSGLRKTGNWVLTFLFLLALYSVAQLAWSHHQDEGLGMNTWMYILASLGAVSLVITYGRAALQGTSDDAPATEARTNEPAGES